MTHLTRRESAASTAFVGSCVAVAPLLWGPWADEQTAHDIRASGFLTIMVVVSGIAPFLLLAWLLDKGNLPLAVGLSATLPLGGFVVLSQYSGFVDSSSTAVAAFPLGGVVGCLLVAATWIVVDVVKASLEAHRRRS